MAKKNIDVKGVKIDELKVGSIVKLPVGFLKGNPRQPRRHFNEESLKNMAMSYARKEDVEYSVMVVIDKSGKFAMIVDGERRWRAAKMVGIEKISCQICEPMDSREIFLTSTKANLCREDMSPVEEAIAIKRLMEDFDWNQREVADEIGKSPLEVSNLLKYLKLMPEIQDKVIKRELGKGIAKLLSSFDQKRQAEMLQVIMNKANGRSVHPNEAARILRKEAAVRGITIRRTRGKSHISHIDLTISHAMTTTQKFVGALEEISLIINEGSFVGHKPKRGVHPLDLIKELEKVEGIVSQVIERLDMVID